MSWFSDLFGDKPGEAASSRSQMRDSMNRLRSIMLRSGMLEDDIEMGPQSTGDPFQDKVSWFIKQVQSARDQIIERNKNQREGLGHASDMAMDSHDIHKNLKALKHDLEGIKKLVDEKDKEIGKARKKEKPEDFISSLEYTYKEQENSYQNCKNALESLHELNAQRGLSEKEAEKHGSGGASGHRAFRPSIDSLKERRRNHHIRVKAGEGKEEEEVGGSNLATNSETAEEYRALKEKQKAQDEALAQLGNVLGDIQQGAKLIGQELDKQNKMLEGQTTLADKLQNNLTDINKNLNKYLKDAKPLSVSMYVIACLLVLAIVGFFVAQFGLG